MQVISIDRADTNQLGTVEYIPTHFKLNELLPKSIHQARRGSPALWRVFDPRILKAADVLRERYGAMVSSGIFCPSCGLGRTR